jgi:hypothetical protein
MKKIILNISDCTYEKLRFEAIEQRKSVPEVIAQAITQKIFTPSVEEAYNEWLESHIIQMMQK